MKRLFVVFCLGLAVMAAMEALANDQVKKVGERKTWQCEITKTSPDSITIDRNGIVDELLVTEIEKITLDSEPAEFAKAREELSKGQNEDARDTLQRVKEGNLSRSLLVAERSYLLAVANARIALSGGDVKLQDAMKGLEKFLDKFPRYFRVRDIQLIYGSMCLQMNKPNDAMKCFQELSKCKSDPIVRAQGLLGVSTVSISKGNADEAMKALSQVKQLLDAGELKARQKEMELSYKIGEARCATIQKDFDKAMKIAQAVINDSSPEDIANNANAYNTLGLALVAQGKSKDAILAFLHTHLLYSKDPSLHSEALTNIAQQWRKLGNDQRAREWEKIRVDRYGK